MDESVKAAPHPTPPGHGVEPRQWGPEPPGRCCYFRGHLPACDRDLCRSCWAPEQRRAEGASRGRESILGLFQEADSGEESRARPAAEEFSPGAGGVSVPVRCVHSGEKHPEIPPGEAGAAAGHMDLQERATGEPRTNKKELPNYFFLSYCP